MRIYRIQLLDTRGGAQVKEIIYDTQQAAEGRGEDDPNMVWEILRQKRIEKVDFAYLETFQNAGELPRQENTSFQLPEDHGLTFHTNNETQNAYIVAVGPFKDVNKFNKFLNVDERKKRGKHYQDHVNRWFFVHPGLWTFITVLLIGIGIAVPVAAPVLVPIAIATLSLAAISLIVSTVRQLGDMGEKYKGGEINGGFFADLRYHFKEWLFGKRPGELNNLSEKSGHGVQAIIVFLGIGLLIATVVCVAGFFTGGGALVACGCGAVAAVGGGAFASIGPILAAIAVPFAAAAAAAGAQVSLAALVTATLVLGVLNVTNIFKKIAEFFDGFEALESSDLEEVPLTVLHDIDDPISIDADMTPLSKGIGNPFAYLGRVFTGIKAEGHEALEALSSSFSSSSKMKQE